MSNSIKKITPVLLAALLWLFGLGTAASGQGLAFEDAWVRTMPPGMTMTAGFGLLVNRGGAAVELVSFSSPDFSDVSLHRSELVDGISRMREVPRLAVAPGKSVELAPGGYHLMLMMPAAATEPDRPVTVEMQTADGQSFRFELPWRQR